MILGLNWCFGLPRPLGVFRQTVRIQNCFIKVENRLEIV